MATIGTLLNLVDLKKQMDPDGGLAKIVEVLMQKNEIIEDIPWMEGNLLTGNRSTIRTGLPTATWRLLNSQTPASKSTTAQVDEACAILESWLESDVDVADLGGNPQAFLGNQAVAHIEALSQEFAQTLFYGNSTTAPEEFTGLSARYSSLSAANSNNVIDGGTADTDNASIWLIDWGTGISGIYPKGSTAGLKQESFGKNIKRDANGNSLVYSSMFKWKPGLTVPDWRCAVRICNIDISLLTASAGEGGSAAKLANLMMMAIDRLPSSPGGSCRFYANRTVRSMLNIQQRKDVKDGGQLSYDVVDGKRAVSFQGIPFRTCDQLTLTETRIT